MGRNRLDIRRQHRRSGHRGRDERRGRCVGAPAALTIQTTGGAGTVTFTGTAGGGSGGAGVRFVGTLGNTAVVCSSGGSVTVIGTGNNDHGVNLTEGGQITGASVGNTVTVTGEREQRDWSVRRRRLFGRVPD